jgi:hypothetical protein
MHTIDAKRILLDPLPYDDPLRIAAERFLGQLAEAEELADDCDLCHGRGMVGGVICRCISRLPDEVDDAFVRGERCR